MIALLTSFKNFIANFHLHGTAGVGAVPREESQPTVHNPDSPDHHIEPIHIEPMQTVKNLIHPHPARVAQPQRKVPEYRRYEDLHTLSRLNLSTSLVSTTFHCIFIENQHFQPCKYTSPHFSEFRKHMVNHGTLCAQCTRYTNQVSARSMCFTTEDECPSNVGTYPGKAYGILFVSFH